MSTQDMGFTTPLVSPFVSTGNDSGLERRRPATRTTVEELETVGSGRIHNRDATDDSECSTSVLALLGLMWYLYPVSSLRSAYFEIKRHVSTNLFDVTVNGLPLTVVRITSMIILIVSDYIYARTLCDVNPDEDDESYSFLYRFQNYIHGLTGLERRQSQISLDFVSVSSYQYGTFHDEPDHELQSVVVVP
jgi:hypothetical protein